MLFKNFLLLLFIFFCCLCCNSTETDYLKECAINKTEIQMSKLLKKLNYSINKGTCAHKLILHNRDSCTFELDLLSAFHTKSAEDNDHRILKVKCVEGVLVPQLKDVYAYTRTLI